MNLALIGYRGTGKTTIAQLLAQQLGWQWVDLDERIEQAAGRSIAEIFAQHGEPEFRRIESEVLAAHAGLDLAILATGGGIVLAPANREQLARMSAVVWLTASPTTLWQRIHGDTTTGSRRPNLTAQGGLAEIEHLLQVRTPLYRECATLEVDTEGRSPGDVAAEIVQRLNLVASPEPA